MQLIKQSCTFLIQESGIDGIYKQIERAGRTCYKSTDKITPESAKPFVDRMINSKHYAMLEHGTVYLAMPIETIIPIGANSWGKYTKNPYSKGFKVCEINGQKRVAVTTNLRVIVENGWWDDLQYICEPTEFHEKRYTLFCTTALHCYKDLTRHRVMSFAIESTRYCNYSKDKFGNELTFIIPTWCKYINPGRIIRPVEIEPLDNIDNLKQYKAEVKLIETFANIEENYIDLIDNGWQAQQAAEILPQSIKGDMIISGFESDWKHLLDLRYYGTTGAPHPMVKELAGLMKFELEKIGYVGTVCTK